MLSSLYFLFQFKIELSFVDRTGQQFLKYYRIVQVNPYPKRASPITVCSVARILNAFISFWHHIIPSFCISSHALMNSSALFCKSANFSLLQKSLAIIFRHRLGRTPLLLSHDLPWIMKMTIELFMFFSLL